MFAVGLSDAGNYQAWTFCPEDQRKLVYVAVTVKVVDVHVTADQTHVRDPFADGTAPPLERITHYGPALGAVFGDLASMRAVRYVPGYQIFGGTQAVHFGTPPNPALSEAGFASVLEAITAVELPPVVNR